MTAKHNTGSRNSLKQSAFKSGGIQDNAGGGMKTQSSVTNSVKKGAGNFEESKGINERFIDLQKTGPVGAVSSLSTNVPTFKASSA